MKITSRTLAVKGADPEGAETETVTTGEIWHSVSANPHAYEVRILTTTPDESTERRWYADTFDAAAALLNVLMPRFDKSWGHPDSKELRRG